MIAVIPTAGTGDIESTIMSLLACNRPTNFRRIAIIGNGPVNRNRVEVLVEKFRKEFPVDYFHVSRGNKSHALNQYIVTLKQNHLLYLTDDDIHFDPNVLVQFAEAADKRAGKVVLGGALKVRSEANPSADLQRHLPTSLIGFPKPNQKIDSARTLFLGANWAAFSDDIKNLGGFDLRFGPGSKLGCTGQESQMMRTMRKAGFEFQFLPDAIVWHTVEDDRFSIKFIRERRYRTGVEAGVRFQLEESRTTPSVPDKVLRFFGYAVRTVAAPFLVPVLRVLRVKQSSIYRIELTASYCRGFLCGWLKSPGERC